MAAAKADDISTTSLLLFFAFWYLGNYYYNIFNKNALTAASDLPLSIATLQLGVGAVYALIVWIIGVNVIPLCGMQAPSKQSLPGTTLADIFALLPVSICSAGAHSASVFAMGGSVAFAQIVKAGEPVFAAVVNTTVYGKSPSFAKWCTLPIIVGGVAFACLKPNAAGAYELSYDMVALVSASVANLFAAFKGSENQKVMALPGVKDRIGGVGNQFALSTILSFLVSIPVMLYKEGDKVDKLIKLCTTDKSFLFNLVASSMCFYLYNELATMTIKKTGAVTASVANTAKRVIVIVGVSIATGEVLSFEKKMGSAIAIGGVLVYSLIDDMLKPKAKSS